MILGAGVRGGPADRVHRHRRDADAAALSQAGRRRSRCSGSPSSWSSPQPHDAEDTPRSGRGSVARGARGRRRQHRDEPRQRHRGGRGGEGRLPRCSALGLAVSIPVVIAGSALFLALLERFPIVDLGRRRAARLGRRRPVAGRSDRRRSYFSEAHRRQSSISPAGSPAPSSSFWSGLVSGKIKSRCGWNSKRKSSRRVVQPVKAIAR